MNSIEDSVSCGPMPTTAQKEALDHYFERTQKRLEAYAYVITGGHQDASGLVSQAYLAMWATMRNNPQMTIPDDRYGFGVIKNLWRRQLRGTPLLSVTAPDYDDSAIQPELRRFERQAAEEYLRDNHFTRPVKLTYGEADMLIRRLPEESRRILLMRNDKMSFAEMAPVLGMSPADVARRYNSVRTHLRSLVKKYLSRHRPMNSFTTRASTKGALAIDTFSLPQ